MSGCACIVSMCACVCDCLSVWECVFIYDFEHENTAFSMVSLNLRNGIDFSA